MSRKGKPVEAVAYMRTSTSTNVGEGKDSEKRQRAAIEAYAKAAGYSIAIGIKQSVATFSCDVVSVFTTFWSCARMLDRAGGPLKNEGKEC
jgi:hypothetical protein